MAGGLLGGRGKTLTLVNFMFFLIICFLRTGGLDMGEGIGDGVWGWAGGSICFLIVHLCSYLENPKISIDNYLSYGADAAATSANFGEYICSP